MQLLPINHDVSKGHTIYWHYTFNEEFPCYTCKFVVTFGDSLMEIVQKINPGQPELPDWVYDGAILGVQGGTDRMLEILRNAQENDVAVTGMWIQDWSGNK